MRQTSTGKCITRKKSLVYNVSSHALPYWVLMTDNCLDDEAQFLYTQDYEILWHIETGGSLLSSTYHKYKNRLAIYVAISRTAKRVQISSRQDFKQTHDGSLSFYSVKRCAQPLGTYVLRKKYCDRPSQTFTFGK